MKLNIQ